MEKKIVVNHTGEKLLLGNDFFVLKDDSHNTFVTSDVKDFFKYFEDSEKGEVFYDHDEATYSVGTGREKKALAKLFLEESIPMQKIGRLNQSGMPLSSFETILRSLRNYMDANGLQILSNLKDFQVNKIKKFERTYDRTTGNYSHKVVQESDRNDFNPPETIEFEVPMFENIDDTFKVVFDFEFTFRENDDGVMVTFTLSNLEFKKEYLDRKKEILKEYMGDSPIQEYWGKSSPVLKDDSWKYKINSQEFQ